MRPSPPPSLVESLGKLGLASPGQVESVAGRVRRLARDLPGFEFVWVDALAQGHSPRRARLGVALAPPKVARHLRRAVGLPERDGLLVHDIAADGPAGRSGLRRGDLIVGVDETTVATVDDLAQALDGAAERGTVRLVVVRGVEEVLLDVSFAPAGGDGPEEGTA